jgi:RpiB/LacA/LacB family sugar-phosphate isomerase
MNTITDAELRAIVEEVVRRTLQGQRASAEDSSRMVAETPVQAGHPKVIALGADHGGCRMKDMLASHLIKAGYQVIDCGTNGTEPVDYPDFALAVAEKVSLGYAWRGIMIDGAGIGSCIAANKVHGVRAAMCYDHATAVNSREHNDANLLTLGAGLIGDNLAQQIVDTWLATDFGGGRHARRVEKINAIEDKTLKLGSQNAH